MWWGMYIFMCIGNKLNGFVGNFSPSISMANLCSQSFWGISLPFIEWITGCHHLIIMWPSIVKLNAHPRVYDASLFSPGPSIFRWSHETVCNWNCALHVTWKDYASSFIYILRVIKIWILSRIAWSEIASASYYAVSYALKKVRYKSIQSGTIYLFPIFCFMNYRGWKICKCNDLGLDS